MSAFLSLLYAGVSYVFFLAMFFYAIGFVGNVFVPRTIDGAASGPLGEALVVNLLLLAVFAVQHSVMARRGFKQWLTRYVPKAIERSTFVFAASAALALLYWQWRPIAEPVIWSVTNPVAMMALYSVFWLGWGTVLLSTFLINHFELFGLHQAFSLLSGRPIPKPEFRTPLLYRHVRHPIYLGFLLGFWAAPVMTAGHLLFAVGTTGYILLGIWFEERDLLAQFGDRYKAYREQVGMLLPRPRRVSSQTDEMEQGDASPSQGNR